ncbi:MAG: hypothetical protein MJ025_04020 [Victivallaceae bacterium]|nr:hypothetical protein [Victivallaceae bacterium]
MNNNPDKKQGDDLNEAIAEFSRTTGVRMELLRRFINRTARDAKAETWDKLYNSLKPYLASETPETKDEAPQRIGPGYRHHNDLVAMFSNQKVLLDEFAVLSLEKRSAIMTMLQKASNDAAPSKYQSLSQDENRLMGYFLALSPEEQESRIAEITKIATDELKERRKELM